MKKFKNQEDELVRDEDGPEECEGCQGQDNSPSINKYDDFLSLFLNGMITDEKVEPYIECIIQENVMCYGETEYINLYLDSVGGDISAAFKLIDTIQMSRIPVRTIGWGQVASSGLLIFMSGQERYISDNASILSHQATFNASEFSAKMIDFQSTQQEFANIMSRIIRHYCRCTGKDEKYIKKHLINHADVWLTSETVIEHGLADAILQDYPAVMWNYRDCEVPEDDALKVLEHNHED